MNSKTNAIGACTILMFLAQGIAPANSQASQEVSLPYPKHGIGLGDGWDSLAGQRSLQNCMLGKPGDPDVTQTRHTMIAEISDKGSVAYALSGTAKASIPTYFGNVSGDATVSNETEVDSSHVNILVDARIEVGSQRLSSPQDGEIALKPHFSDLSKSNPLEFRRQCGDHFVTTLTRAAGVRGIYNFDESTAKDKQTFLSNVTVAIGSASGTVDLNFDLTKNTSHSSYTLTTDPYGGIGLSIPTDDTTFRQYVQQLGVVTSVSNSALVEFSIRPYSDLEKTNYGGPTNLSTEVEQNVALEYYRLVELDSRIDTILNSPSSFFWDGDPSRNVDPVSLRNTQKSIESDISDLSDAMSQCAKSPKSCAFPPHVSRNDYEYRAQIPIELSQVEIYREVEDLTADATANQQKGAIDSQTDRPGVPQAGRLELLQAAADRAKIADDQLPANWKSVSERYEINIQLVDQTRCSLAQELGEKDYGCLGASGEDNIRKAMR